MDANLPNPALNDARRAQAEDALKHLHRCQQRGQSATVESLAGALNVESKRASQMLAGLQSAGLATLQDGNFRLTQRGAAYALQVIRAHRLYETYLAEQTGSAQTDWHREADIQEHKLSENDVNKLAQSLGHPRFDPHGDPIPTAAGVVPPAQGTALCDWRVGEPARIVHVEDEPETVFAQLAAIGFCPGIELRVVESTPQRIVVQADGEQHVLAPVVAANVTVIAAPQQAREPSTPTELLSALPLGARACVVNVSPRCRGAERRRLLDLGIVPGTVVEAVMRSPMGDPTAYRVRESLIALRKQQSDFIQIRRLGREAA
jgi:DtxR family Mn-dependent transcriptional regulator